MLSKSGGLGNHEYRLTLGTQALTDGYSKLSLPTVSLEKSRYWSALMAGWWQKIIPSKNDRELKRISVLVDQIASLEAKYKALIV